MFQSSFFSEPKLYIELCISQISFLSNNKFIIIIACLIIIIIPIMQVVQVDNDNNDDFDDDALID